MCEEDEETIASERLRKVTIAAGVICEERPRPLEWDTEKIDNWSQLVRRTAWQLRLRDYKRLKRPITDNCKTRTTVTKKDKDGNFQVSEIRVECLCAAGIRNAEMSILRKIQREHYPETYEALANNEKIHHRSRLNKLRPLWDAENRVIRVIGRMDLAIRERTPNPPILLPANHPIVDLYITDNHIRLDHAGVKTTHSSLRHTVWIVRGIQQVKRVLHKCITCNKLQSRPFDQLAAPMPIERVRKARPFDQCGVDFAGPIFYKPYKYVSVLVISINGEREHDE